MEIDPTPDQESFIRQAMQTGRIARPEDAVAQALALWEERERRRAEILVRLDGAEMSFERGEGLAVTEESLQSLADGVKQRGRAGLAAEPSRAS